jgi:hypothetical protein
MTAILKLPAEIVPYNFTLIYAPEKERERELLVGDTSPVMC